MPNILVDTGPLVALFDRSERHHERVSDFFKRFAGGALFSTWPVITEAAYFLGDGPGQGLLLQWIAGGNLHIEHVEAEAAGDLQALMRKYADLPMDLADASLVWLADRRNLTEVLTIDRRDFSVYRRANGRKFTQVLE